MKKLKALLCIIMSVILIVLSLNLFVYSISDPNGFICEKKIYINATLEDDFADNRIIVVLKNEESLSFYDSSKYTNIISSAGKVKKVKDLTQSLSKSIEEKIALKKMLIIRRLPLMR